VKKPSGLALLIYLVVVAVLAGAGVIGSDSFLGGIIYFVITAVGIAIAMYGFMN
jgi:hypothetical protein